MAVECANVQIRFEKLVEIDVEHCTDFLFKQL